MWRETVCVVVVWVIRRWLMQRGSLCLRRCGYDPTRAPLWLATVTSYARWLVSWKMQQLLLMHCLYEKLVGGLDGSMSQRDASLESIATILKNNPGAVSKFVELQNGRALRSVIELTRDRFSRTMLLACLCLICIKNSSSCFLQDIAIKTKLIYILLELLDDSGQFGEEASFAFSSLVAGKEDLQKLAFEANAIDKFYNHLQNPELNSKRLEGIFLALGDLCSKLECCRSRFMSLQGMYAVSNIASGNEFHKEAIMQMIFPQAESGPQSFLSQYLQSNDSRLRTSAAWIIANLTAPASPGAFGRIAKLRNFGLVAQIKRMASDPCMDVKKIFKIDLIIPELQNMYGSMHSSGLGLSSGYAINGMYPSNTAYSQYGNTYRARSNFGSTAYGSRAGSFDNKFKTSSYGRGFDHVKKNTDGFGELNKGPRGSNSSDDKSVKSLGPVTLLLKGQDLPIKSDDNKEVHPVPNKQQFNGEDLSESYSDAKFYVIKSYSEDDIHKSMKYNVWTSTPNGNKKLDAAYQDAKEKPGDCPIFLLFS
ncbi:hypothetical protein RYX36_029354, partial [Vicia faba]